MFALCVTLGCRHPDELGKQLTSLQLSEWIAYGNRNPFGPAYQHYLLAQIASTVRNSGMAKGKPASPYDYLPGYERPQKNQAEMHAIIEKAKIGNRSKHRRKLKG